MRSSHRSIRRLGAAMLVIAALGAACSRSDEGAGPSIEEPTATSSTSTTTVAPDPGDCTPGGAGAGVIGTFEVGRDERTVVDTSRGVVASGLWAERAAAERTIPVVVLYPSAGGAPATADGPFPIVMYSHGIGSAGTERNDVLERWASAGFVVVAPTFPLSSWTNDPSDMMNQPSDVAFVLDTIRAAGTAPGDALNGLVRSGCVALAGHSLGGFTTMAAAFDSCCGSIDPTALVDIAGVFVGETGGGRLVDMDPLPTLLVHGTLDPTLPVTMSESTRDLLTGPTWYLNFPDGNHNDMFVAPKVEVLDDAVVSFLTAWLYEQPAELESLPERVDSSGLGTFEILRTP